MAKVPYPIRISQAWPGDPQVSHSLTAGQDVVSFNCYCQVIPIINLRLSVTLRRQFETYIELEKLLADCRL